MGIADLHIHTSYSWDGTSTISAILQYAKDRKLDIVAITDHDTIAGHAEAFELAAIYNIQIIPGVEISTADGHLLAYFIHEPIPAKRSLIQTIEKIGQQGGLCVAAHPEAKFVHAIKEEALSIAASIPAFEDVLVGVETVNAGLLYRKSNHLAAHFSPQYHLSAVGGSDSHIHWTVGDAVTYFSGESIADLRRNLLIRKTQSLIKTETRPPLYFVQHVHRRLLRKFGWVASSTGPNLPYGMQRIIHQGQ
jgi:predicted metal-dependent phosphoesterase TrpH